MSPTSCRSPRSPTPSPAREFRFWSTIALSYRFGVPGKMAEEGVQREQLIFATTHGYVPWDSRAPEAARLNARSAQLNEAKTQELALQAETREAEKPVVIEAKADNETDLESLESVNPDAFNPGRRRRPVSERP